MLTPRKGFLICGYKVIPRNLWLVAACHPRRLAVENKFLKNPGATKPTPLQNSKDSLHKSRLHVCRGIPVADAFKHPAAVILLVTEPYDDTRGIDVDSFIRLT